MNKIKIVIVEDEIIIAKTIVLALKKLCYEVVGSVGKYKEAIEIIAQNKTDLVLLDINLGTKKDGIDLAFEIKKSFNIPIIFITANSDPGTISRAKVVNPLAFLVKPFSQTDLYTAIEIGWNNFNTIVNSDSQSRKHIVLKVGYTFEKVVLDDVVYLKNDKHYFDIHLTLGKKIVVRYTTNEMRSLLPSNQFIKLNRSYIINIQHIVKLESKFVFMPDIKIPVTESLYKELALMI